MGLRAGTQLGPYEILSAVGAGGMGKVYRARDTRLERIVAIKILPDHLSTNRCAESSVRYCNKGMTSRSSAKRQMGWKPFRKSEYCGRI